MKLMSLLESIRYTTESVKQDIDRILNLKVSLKQKVRKLILIGKDCKSKENKIYSDMFLDTLVKDLKINYTTASKLMYKNGLSYEFDELRRDVSGGNK